MKERIADAPDELPTLLDFLAVRLVGEEEGPSLARESATWIDEHLGREYAWPGNVRELEQCVRNVLIHRNYRPATSQSETGWRQRLVERIFSGEMPAEELLRAYCTLVYSRTGSYVRTAERLGLDRRTVRNRIDADLLAEMRGSEGEH